MLSDKRTSLRPYARGLLLGLIFWAMLEELLISMLHFPSALRYINDVLVLALTVYILPELWQKLRLSGFRAVVWAVGVYGLILAVGTLRGGTPVLLVLWAVRNTFRFFAYFAVCVCLLRREDVERILKCLVWLQIPNLVLVLAQYSFLNVRQDNIGGIFGTADGVNAYLNIYFSIVLCYMFSRYLSGGCGFVPLALTTVSCMVICGMVEIKIVYLELVLIAAGAILLNKLSRRSLYAALTAAVALAVGMLVLKNLYLPHYKVISSIGNMVSYANQEDGAYYLSRMHAVEKINELFFHLDPWLNLFGMGFGSCEMSSFSFLTSDFYRENGNWNYRWFTHQMTYLESGALGLIALVAVFAVLALCCLRGRKALAEQRALWCTGLLMTLLTMANLFYNAAIRMETAYLVYFALSIVPVCVLSARTSPQTP